MKRIAKGHYWLRHRDHNVEFLKATTGGWDVQVNGDHIVNCGLLHEALAAVKRKLG